MHKILNRFIDNTKAKFHWRMDRISHKLSTYHRVDNQIHHMRNQLLRNHQKMFQHAILLKHNLVQHQKLLIEFEDRNIHLQ